MESRLMILVLKKMKNPLMKDLENCKRQNSISDHVLRYTVLKVKQVQSAIFSPFFIFRKGFSLNFK